MSLTFVRVPAWLKHKSFVIKQVRHQLGCFIEQPITHIPLNSLYECNRFPSHLFSVYSAANNCVHPINRGDQLFAFRDGKWKPSGLARLPKLRRSCTFLNQLSNGSNAADYAFDFQDARRGFSFTPLAGSKPCESFPIFQYNRLSCAQDSILWPLRGYHDIRSFPKPGTVDDRAFTDKQPKVCWRGALCGFAELADKHESRSMSVRKVVECHGVGTLDDDTAIRFLRTNSRFRFVSMFADEKWADIGFVAKPDKADILYRSPLTNRYFANPLTPSEHCYARYLVAISGWDVATSLVWMLSTQSLVLKETYQYECFLDCHFEPWKHFIPLEPDFSDMLEKLEWCERHHAECQRIIRNANDMVALISNGHLRKLILSEVIAHYERHYRP